MHTNRKTVVTRIILLAPGEQFQVRPPGALRKRLVRLIEVHVGYFSLYGGTGRTGGATRINYSFGGTDEVPSMPAVVAEEIHRCLAAFEQEGGSITNVAETPAPVDSA